MEIYNMRRFLSILVVLAIPATMYAAQPVRTLVRAKPVRSAIKGVYQSVGEVRSYGSTGKSYGSVGTSVASYGSTGTATSYGSVGGGKSYGSTGK